MHPLATSTSAADRPRVVQLSMSPAFVGGGSYSVRCEHCGHLLANEIPERSLIAIDIECYNCKLLTRTEQWPDGETLPYPLMSIGDRGAIRISQLVLKSGTSISCDAEIIRVRSLTAAKPIPPGGPTNLTLELLDAWEAELNMLTGQEFSKKIAAANRARATGNMSFLKCPPAWAILHLKARLEAGKFVPNREDAIAAGYISQLRDLIKRWRHHAHFGIIANSLCSEFNHASTMLAAAGYMSSHGNDIGITNTVSMVGRSPDLYLNLGFGKKLSIEVKAPELFFWPSASLSLQDTERHIHKVLRSAREQITGEAGGVVVLGASHPQKEIKEVFAKAVRNAIDSGKVSTRIAAIMCVFYESSSHAANGMVNWQTRAAMWAEKNPRFPGRNPINTGE